LTRGIRTRIVTDMTKTSTTTQPTPRIPILEWEVEALQHLVHLKTVARDAEGVKEQAVATLQKMRATEGLDPLTIEWARKEAYEMSGRHLKALAAVKSFYLYYAK
jgi:hypothetical protein